MIIAGLLFSYLQIGDSRFRSEWERGRKRFCNRYFCGCFLRGMFTDGVKDLSVRISLRRHSGTNCGITSVAFEIVWRGRDDGAEWISQCMLVGHYHQWRLLLLGEPEKINLWDHTYMTLAPKPGFWPPPLSALLTIANTFWVTDIPPPFLVLSIGHVVI